MAEKTDLFTRAIEKMIAFPATVIRILFRPSTVFGNGHEAPLCPPGVALLIGLTVWFWGSRTLLRISSGDLAVPLSPGNDVIARIIVGIAVLVLLQTFLLRRLFRTSWDWRTFGGYLAYPIAIVLFAIGAVEIAGVYFPSVVRTLARGQAGTFSLQVTWLASLLTVILYPWATFNVVRASLNAPSRGGLGMSVVALVALVAVAAGGVFLMSDLEERVKRLAYEEATQL